VGVRKRFQAWTAPRPAFLYQFPLERSTYLLALSRHVLELRRNTYPTAKPALIVIRSVRGTSRPRDG
jgi:hypothetical protein